MSKIIFNITLFSGISKQGNNHNKSDLQWIFRFRNLNIHPVFKDSHPPTNSYGFMANMKTNSSIKTKRLLPPKMITGIPTIYFYISLHFLLNPPFSSWKQWKSHHFWKRCEVTRTAFTLANDCLLDIKSLWKLLNL